VAPELSVHAKEPPLPPAMACVPLAVSTDDHSDQSIVSLTEEGRLIAVPVPSRWAMRSIDVSLLAVQETVQRPAPVAVVAPLPGWTIPNCVAVEEVQPLVIEVALGMVAVTTVPELAPPAIAVASAHARASATRARANARVKDRRWGIAC
jgi:hypothetical protein